MKKIGLLILMIGLLFALTVGCGNQEISEESEQKETTQTAERDKGDKGDMHHIQITVENRIFTASLYDNETVRALLKRLPLTIQMDELHGNEKYYYLSSGLPSTPERVSQINVGDIKLYGSDCLVLFYENVPTTYAYTSLGSVDHTQGLAEALGAGNVTVQIEKV